MREDDRRATCGVGEDGLLRPVARVADVDDHAETVHLADDGVAAMC